LLTVILTDVARLAEFDWSIAAAELSLAGWGLFAVLAGNPLTLLLAWTAIDLLSLIILLGEVKQAGASRQLLLRFSLRLAGSFLLIAGDFGPPTGLASPVRWTLPGAVAFHFRCRIAPGSLPIAVS
jgi:hypothetical protein